VSPNLPRRRILAAVAAAASVALGGCASTPSADGASTGDPGSTTSESTGQTTAESAVGSAARDRLDETLVGLVESSDREQYAADSGLTYEDGRALVVVELREGASVPESPPVDVEVRHESLVQGFVDVDDLPALATSEGVAFVRPPNEPTKHGVEPSERAAASGSEGGD
jgi:hypothetical protein